MDPTAIVFPAIAMFFLTMSMVARMAYLRVTAVQRGDVPIQYYRLYYEGVEPDRLRQIGRHVQNHFEVPPLFYVAVLFLYATGSVTPIGVGLAWLYVALRAVHSVVHLLTSANKRNELSEAASAYAQRHLTPNAVYGELLDFLNRRR